MSSHSWLKTDWCVCGASPHSARLQSRPTHHAAGTVECVSLFEILHELGVLAFDELRYVLSLRVSRTLLAFNL